MGQNDGKFDDIQSVLNVPVKISVKSLEKTINDKMEGSIYEDDTMEDGDKMMLKAEKAGEIKLVAESQMIKYRVPLKLWIKYDIGLGKVEADGELALDFKTSFELAENWKVVTTTEVESHEWLKNPKLRMGALRFPVKSIANLALKRSKQLIAEGLDQTVQESFSMDTMVNDTWNRMFDPLLISEDYNTWLVINPESLSIAPIIVKDDTIQTALTIVAKPRVKLGLKPEKGALMPLPPFKYSEEHTDDFNLVLNTEVTFEEAQRIASEQLLGETFEQSGKTVRVEGIEIEGKGNKIIINTRLSGSFTGKVSLTGKPHFDQRKQAIDIKDLEFTLETRNFLHKSAGWLLKSAIKKKIRSNINDLLDYKMEEMTELLQKQMTNYQAARGVWVNGKLDDLKIENAYLGTESIKIKLLIKGRVEALVGEELGPM